MNRVLLGIISIIIAVAFSCSQEEKKEYAVITFLMGNVKLNATSVEIGTIIKEKDKLNIGKDSFCDVKIGGSIIRIKEKSEVVISSLLKQNNLEKTKLGLSIGKMLCKPKKLLKSESFIVKTPTAVAAVRGTRFSIEADKKKTTRIKVYNGKLKVAKRIKQFEANDAKVLALAPVLNESKKIVITRKEVVKSEKIVENLLKYEKKTNKSKAEVLNRVIEKSNKRGITLSKKSIVAFKVSDFIKEKNEIIKIKPKPRKVIRRIVKVIKKEKKDPTPQGRLYITRFEIYYIFKGKLVWEGNVVKEAMKKDGKIYIASGNNVFCASKDGPVYWRTQIVNNGNIKIKGDSLLVESGNGKTQKLSLLTGKKI